MVTRPKHSRVDTDFMLSNLRRDNATGCWEWIKCRNSDGYGNLWYNGRLEKAHRAAYELWNKPIPHGLRVLHKCDNPPCCNPRHLFLGTQKDNVRDCISKGRYRNPIGSGVNHFASKLTEDQVRIIRSTTGVRKWSRLFGVTDRVILLVRKRVSYRNVKD